MEKTDCIEIGRLIKTFGYKGEYSAQIEKEFLQIMINEGSVFIETDEELVPYFIEYCEPTDKDFCILKFEDIDDVDVARTHSASILWFPAENIKAKSIKYAGLLTVKDYRVVDKNHGEVGLAQEVIKMPEQQILRILKGKKEILLPVNETFIVAVNHQKKQIDICAPDGLIDFYLE